jgi:DNA-binding GntR family transcriptional regulator
VAGARPKAFGRTSTLFFHLQGATFRELNEARLILEPMMARLAAERQDPSSLERLAELIDAGHGVELEDDLDWARSSAEFHGIVASMSGNHILDLFCESLKEVWFGRVAGQAYPSDDRERVRRDHEAVAKAVASGDGPRAERLMQEHMEDFSANASTRFEGILDEVVDWR